MQPSRSDEPGCPVFLTGMMGAGKSTIAPLLAARWRATWIDHDARVERVFGETIPECFAISEAYFRVRESASLHALLREPGVRGHTLVIATGGGLVVDDANRRRTRERGVVVYLQVPAALLATRVMRSGALGNRPLLGDTLDAVQTRLSELLARRAAAYEAADVIIDASGPPPASAAAIDAAVMAVVKQRS